MDETAQVRAIEAASQADGPLNRISRSLLFRRLAGIREGTLTIAGGDHARSFGSGSGPSATVRVRDGRFYRRALLGGSVGAGASYMDGHWTADDLVSVVRILARNAEALERMEGGTAVLSRPFLRLFHALRRNTEAGSRRNIADHYDLGNDFYRLFLDASMAYSCGIYVSPRSTLEEAQAAKYDRVCRRLDLRQGDHLLEIGCGWGGFAIHAAERFGCRVTGITISESQAHLARERVREAGLTGRVAIRLEDYRRTTGVYDKIVSIEMIEAVGHHYLDDFFRRCDALLSPRGTMLLQAITVPDRIYRRHIRSVDFIKRYIFPGSFIPSVAALCGAAARTDLRPVHLEEITPHYARTLAEWRNRFLSRKDEVRAMGFPERFLRMWEFYLCYCEGSFSERYNGVVQLLFAKPSWRHPQVPPMPVGSEAAPPSGDPAPAP